MYTLRHLPPDPTTDARGLTLDEAFNRLMGLGERHYAFVRTGWAMQLLMTSHPPSAPDFVSWASSNAVARREIKEQVCRHGLGQFTVMPDEEYLRLIAGEKIAAE